MSQESDSISASTISTTATTGGCHLLKITGYSQSKQLPDGTNLRSCEFEAAGRSWCIEYVPRPPKKAEYVALALELITEGVGQPINTTVRFTLVPHHGKPEPATAPHYRSGRSRFHRTGVDRKGAYWFYPFITWEGLEGSGYLVDDCFSVRCDIHVIDTSAVADEVVQAHDLERMGLACSCTDDLCKRRHASSLALDLKKETPSDSASGSGSTTTSVQRRIKSIWFRLFGRKH
ncbi:hypothetical protein ZWY2020_022057 [Hordeum vulgare]|nr:hypothetical protein ZWY2020_022057 [Hordeum vulgare]